MLSALTVLLAPTLYPSPIPQQAQRPIPLQAGAGTIRIAYPWMTYLVVEGNEGEQDLNGDGDADDLVVFLFDARTGQSTNLGLASTGHLELKDGLAVFAISEAQQGADLDGDGLLENAYVHVYRCETGELINTGLPGEAPAAPLIPGSYSIGEEKIAFRASESQAKKDFNADGDLEDNVVFAYDVATGVGTNLGVAGTTPFVAGSFVGFSVVEAKEAATDLNGDGDTEDLIARIYDLENNTFISLGAGQILGSGPLLITLNANEPSGGIDANSDGDLLDLSSRFFNTATESIVNTHLATSGTQAIDIFGELYSFTVTESAQSADLNLDGDLDDRLWYVHDAATGATTNTGFQAVFFPDPAIKHQAGFAAIPAYEGNSIDLNGDGDSEDLVLQVLTDQGALNLGFAMSSHKTSSKYIAFLSPEAKQGGQDLNADGDALDSVLFVHEVESERTWNLGSTAVQFEVSDDGIVYTSERAWDSDRITLAWGQPNALKRVHLPRGSLSSAKPQLKADGALAAVRVIEQHLGRDLNRDGDLEDTVLVALPMR